MNCLVFGNWQLFTIVPNSFQTILNCRLLLEGKISVYISIKKCWTIEFMVTIISANDSMNVYLPQDVWHLPNASRNIINWQNSQQPHICSLSDQQWNHKCNSNKVHVAEVEERRKKQKQTTQYHHANQHRLALSVHLCARPTTNKSMLLASTYIRTSQYTKSMSVKQMKH